MNHTNEAAGLIAEYAQRKKLAKLGYTSPISELPAWKADQLCTVADEIDRMLEEETKRAQKGR